VSDKMGQDGLVLLSSYCLKASPCCHRHGGYF